MTWIQFVHSMDCDCFSEALPFVAFITFSICMTSKDKETPQYGFPWNLKLLSVIEVFCMFTIFSFSC